MAVRTRIGSQNRAAASVAVWLREGLTTRLQVFRAHPIRDVGALEEDEDPSWRPERWITAALGGDNAARTYRDAVNVQRLRQFNAVTRLHPPHDSGSFRRWSSPPTVASRTGIRNRSEVGPSTAVPLEVGPIRRPVLVAAA